MVKKGFGKKKPAMKVNAVDSEKKYFFIMGQVCRIDRLKAVIFF